MRRQLGSRHAPTPCCGVTHEWLCVSTDERGESLFLTRYACSLQDLITEKESEREAAKEAADASAAQIKEWRSLLEAAVKAEDYREAARLKKLISQETGEAPRPSRFDQKPEGEKPGSDEESISEASEEEGEEGEGGIVPPPPTAVLEAVKRSEEREELRAKVS